MIHAYCSLLPHDARSNSGEKPSSHDVRSLSLSDDESHDQLLITVIRLTLSRIGTAVHLSDPFILEGPRGISLLYWRSNIPSWLLNALGELTSTPESHRYGYPVTVHRRWLQNALFTRKPLPTSGLRSKCKPCNEIRLMIQV